MLRPRHFLVPLALALAAIAWLAVSEHTPESSADARATQTNGDVTPAAIESLATDRRADPERPRRAQLRVLDRTGAPRAFGPLTVSAPGGSGLAELECDSEGWLRFESLVEHGAVWITGPLVFGEVARLDSKDGLLDYGTLRLRARGVLAVDVTGIADATSTVKLALRYRNDAGETPDFGEELVVPVKSGRASATLRIEALRPVYVAVEGDGLRHAFREREVVVEPGATELVRLALDELCSLRARVEGLAPQALVGNVVDVLGVHDEAPSPRSDAEAPSHTLGALARTASARAALDASARFNVGAMERLTVRADLIAPGLRVPLVSRDRPGEPLTTCTSHEFSLEPAELLVAVGVVERGEQSVAPREFALGFSDDPLDLLQTPPNGWRLVRRADIVGRPPLHVFAPGLGLATIDDPSDRLDSSGLLRVAVDEFAHPQAPILIEFYGQLPYGLKLIVRAADSSRLRFASDGDFERALSVKRSPRSITVSHAPCGEYHLIWSHSEQQRRAERISHDGSRTTRVVLAPPSFMDAPGEVVVSSESKGSAVLGLVRSVVAERCAFAVADGGFRHLGFDPPPSEVDVRMSSGLRVPAVARMVDGVLRVEFASEALRELQLAPLRGGRLVAEPWPCVECSPARRSDSLYIQQTAPTQLLVAAGVPRARGRVWEIGDGFKLLRGWYDETQERDSTFAGRRLELTLSAPRGPLSIAAVGPDDPLGAPLARWSGAQSTHVWLPNATTALRLEFADGSVTTVERLSDRLVVD